MRFLGFLIFFIFAAGMRIEAEDDAVSVVSQEEVEDGYGDGYDYEEEIEESEGESTEASQKEGESPQEQEHKVNGLLSLEGPQEKKAVSSQDLVSAALFEKGKRQADDLKAPQASSETGDIDAALKKKESSFDSGEDRPLFLDVAAGSRVALDAQDKEDIRLREKQRQEAVLPAHYEQLDVDVPKDISIESQGRFGRVKTAVDHSSLLVERGGNSLPRDKFGRVKPEGIGSRLM